jgi:filamentous hemagglutinin
LQLNTQALKHTGSLIGSNDGRVDIVAGGDVAIIGIDVLSREDIAISGENVTIAAVEDVLSVSEGRTFKQGGINVSLKGGWSIPPRPFTARPEAATRFEDDLQALYAAKVGQTLFSNGQAWLNSFADTASRSATWPAPTRTQAIGNSGLSVIGSQIKGDNVALVTTSAAARSASRLAAKPATSSSPAKCPLAAEGDIYLQSLFSLA